ncbi:metadherin a isoform X3 [Pangasianodon hypophthalmus]|uniref:metadherin a isoform X3 n=1 Tax=Pangasianodon hypophthalmus TaxID=310915 RepID=UPI002307D609|nr:metadherin a isoform X3 [Pangasianodon hypophthalmus]
MASSWGGVVSEQADLISTRLRQLVSSGLHFLRDELGIDLGLKPELYPAWLILSTALIGLFLLLVLVAACGGARRRKQGAARSKSTAAVSATESAKAAPVKAPKPDEPKKKNKKKAAEKKNQSNGGTAPDPREQVKVVKEFPKQAPPPPPAAPAAAAAAGPPPPQPQASVDAKAEKAKKSKKKPKPEVKPTQAVSSTDGKEPDEGAWETKISNREKRQQRKKEKGPNDESGSPRGGQHVGQQTELPAVTAPVNTKKNKESLNVKAAKSDANVTPVQSTWNNVSSVNSGGWTDISVKLPPKGSAPDHEKSSVAIKTSGHRTSEPLAWAQESEAGSWPTMDGRMKPEVNRMNFSMLRLNPSAGVPVTQSAAEVGNGFTNADEWSGFNGLGAVDPSSDWNAPTELWGNYDEPKPETPAAQETPVSQVPRLQESDDDKDKGDPSGSGKSKRKKKKKKKPEDENAGSQVTTESSTAPAESGFVKPRPHVPVEEPTKQIIAPQSGQKKSDQNLEPLKQVQKKKARRET